MFKSLKDVLSSNLQLEKRKSSSFSQRGPLAANKSAGLFDFHHLIDCWPELVGPHLAKKTSPLKIQDKKMIIAVTHPLLAQELHLMAPLLIQKIVDRFPLLKKHFNQLFFRVAPDFFIERSTAAANHPLARKEGNPVRQIIDEQYHPHSPLYKELRLKGEKIFCDLQNKEIKEQFIALYIQKEFMKVEKK